MKRAIRITSFSTNLIVILFFILLGVCLASEKDEFMKNTEAIGINPLSASEITELYSGSTEYGKNQKYEWEGFYSATGQVKGRAWWNGGEAIDDGEWKATDEGHLCFEYFGKWSENGERCFAVYPSSGEYNYTLVQKTGSQSSGWPDGIIPVKVTPK